MEVAKLTDVTRVYRIGEVQTRALNGVSLTIGNGEFTSLVGPSGSGKTTLLQLIGCLDRPSSGSVVINGQETTNLNRNQRADPTPMAHRRRRSRDSRVASTSSTGPGASVRSR